MQIHNLYFLLHGDLEQAKKDSESWKIGMSPEDEMKLYESFIVRNQRVFSQSMNARLSHQAATGPGLGVKEVFDVIKGFSDDDRVTIKKYVVTVELGEKPKVIEVEADLEEKMRYLKELVERELGVNGTG